MGKQGREFDTSSTAFIALGVVPLVLAAWALVWGDLPTTGLSFLFLVVLPVAAGLLGLVLGVALLWVLGTFLAALLDRLRSSLLGSTRANTDPPPWWGRSMETARRERPGQFGGRR